MIDPAELPTLAMVSAIGAVAVWAVVLVRSLRQMRRGVERRRTFAILMPVAALTTALGTLASAVGSAVIRGTLVIDINLDTLSLIASMGRGALLMAGIIVLSYRPSKT